MRLNFLRTNGMFSNYSHEIRWKKVKTSMFKASLCMVVVLFTFSVFNACSKNDEKHEEEDTVEIIGTWTHVDGKFSFTFRSNGSYKYKEEGYTEEGTYVLRSSILTLYDEYGDFDDEFVIESISATTMKFQDEDGFIWTFRKGSGGNNDSDDDNNNDNKDDSNENGISAPKGVVASYDGSYVTVSWKSVSNATVYNIYRSSSASGYYSRIGESKTISFMDLSPLAGDNYYKIKATGMYEESDFSMYAYCSISSGNNPGNNPGNNEQKPSAPTGVTCENKGPVMYPSINISWNAVPNATSYEVYRSKTPNGRYTQLGNSTSFTYYIDDAPNSGDNYYKVKAVNSAGESDYSSYVLYKHDPQSVLEPAIPTVTASGTSPVKLSWTVGTGSNVGIAKSFEVHRRNPKTGEYELLTTTTNKSYSDYSPFPGINRYGVIAIGESGNESKAGYAYSKEVPLATPTGFTATRSYGNVVKFSWEKVKDATGYQIYYSVNKSHNIVLKKIDENINNYTDMTPFTGTTIYYTIVAVFAPDDYTDVRSECTSYVSVTFP